MNTYPPPKNGMPMIHERRGSALMIVIVLMGLLAVLGVLFYVFAASERSNAEYFAEGGKKLVAPALSADEVMDFGLQQLIIGTDPRLKNSALWGSRHSILANMLGIRHHQLEDLVAFNGQGIHLAMDADGLPVVDLNRDMIPDTGPLTDEQGIVNTGPGSSDVQDLLGMNDSPASNAWFERDTGRFPQPDVGYTYPDINNMFLAYTGWTRDRQTGLVKRVVIPSFHRPQLLRELWGGTLRPIPLAEDHNYNGTLDTGEDLNGDGQLDYGAKQPNRILRPHPNHVYVPRGSTSGPPVRRFITTAAEAQSLLGDGRHVFPFLPMYQNYNPSSDGTTVTLNGKPREWIGHQGLWSGHHPVSSNYDDEYQYDVDNDGDGVREGIWLDLDFPVQEDEYGTLYTILHSFTVYDLDALFNLNVHGNIQKLLFRYLVPPEVDVAFHNVNNPFGWRTSTGTFEFISASNMGMMPAEVNPTWGLTARNGIETTRNGIDHPSNIFEQHQRFYGNAPLRVTPLPPPQQRLIDAWRETANMELAWLKMGRPQLSASGTVDRLHPGLYGEEHLIAQHVASTNNNPLLRDPRAMPHPGASGHDDNTDINDHMPWPPASRGTGDPTRPTWLEVEQPYDALGFGQYWSNPKALDLFNPTLPTSRQRWLRFTDYTSNGNVFWGLLAPPIQGGQLMRVGAPPYTLGGQPFALFDDPSEVALWPKDRRDVDDPFTSADAAWLQLSNNDIATYQFESRLRDLAPFNFSPDNNENSRGEDIRRRFTTLANDVKRYALPRGYGFNNNILGRTWEWTDDHGLDSTSPNHGLLKFPPTFGAVNTPIPRYQIAPMNEDPFRQPVRFLLEATQYARDRYRQYQQRLGINQLLIYDGSELQYRDLTPHPVDPGRAPIPTAASLNVNQASLRPNLAGLTPQLQEFWARRDRQMLARDIYVLLYLLGTPFTGDANNNPTRPNWITGTSGYTPQQLEQMARFAVNLVDAQDRDNVMTRFEYDTDLSDGWNLDDDPYTTNDGGSQRGEVWGVERQELALSEVLWVHVPQSPLPRTYTAWDDSADRQFLYVELRNLAPYDIKFIDNMNWQLLIRQEPTGMMATPTTPPQWRRLTLRNNAGLVPAGGFYTLFSTDRNEPSTNPSFLRVDPNGGSNYVDIAPSDPTLAGNASTTGNFIDLVKEYNQDAFQLTDGDGSTNLSTTPGGLLNDGGTGLVFDASTGTPLHIILLRRAHPTREAPSSNSEEADNPWIEVDRYAVEPKFANFPAVAIPTQIQTVLDDLKSRERREILARETEGDANPANAATDHIWNTLKAGSAAENSSAPNNNPATPFQLRHIHPDRVFMSLGELLHLPLVGPEARPLSDDDYTNDRKDGLTTYWWTMHQTPRHQYGEPSAPSSPVNPPIGLTVADLRFRTEAKNFAAKVLLPDHPVLGNSQHPGQVDREDNCWYRLLEFIEIPTRQHKNLGMGSIFEIRRQAGKINLNTLRHPEVLAGIIDDEQICQLIQEPQGATGNQAKLALTVDPAENEDTNVNGILDETDLNMNGQIDRTWFEQLQFSRDGLDPLWQNRLALPGLPNSRPFLSLSEPTERIDRTLEYSLLRELPADLALPYDSATNSPPENRHHRLLFEVGTHTEHFQSTIDPELRYRILSKIWGNTTVRSNCFVVFVSAKKFRVAIDPTSGAVRIGGPLRVFHPNEDPTPEEPEYRGVFIVDRTLVEEVIQDNRGQITSFKPFVVYRNIFKK